MSKWLMCVLAVLVAVPSVALDSKRVARAQSQIGKGQKQLEKGDYDKAEKYFQSAIEIQPEVPSAYVNMGAVRIGQERFADALEMLKEGERRYIEWQQLEQEMKLAAQQSATTQAQDMAFNDNSGKGLITGGIQAQAERSNRTSQKQMADNEWGTDDTNPVPAQLYYLRGVATIRLGQRDAGIEALQKCLELDPDHGLAHYNLAVALFGKGDIAGAKQNLDAAKDAGVKPNPKFVEAVESAAKQ